MSQNDFSIANQGFPSFRSDLNDALQALASNSSGTSAPSTTYAYQWWYDETNDILKIRNSANDAWIDFATFDQTTDTWSFASVTVDGDLTVDTDTLYVDSANNRVGVNQSTPTDQLHIGTDDLIVDASGNVLVGTTSGNPAGGTGTGVQLNGGAGQVNVSRSGGASGVFNRTTSDGDIVDFRKDGSTLGSIGVNSSDQLYISRAAGSQGIKFKNGGAIPCNADGSDSDNDQDLGISSVRWDDIYATNGTIQTSDRNEKQDIEALSDAEQRVAVAAKGLLRKYRWKDAVEEKGDAARIHFGIIAQDLQDAFAAEGLDAGRYGMFISSTWWESEETYTDDDGVEQTRTNTYDTLEAAPEGAIERTRMGVRYPELLAFIIAAI